MRELMQVAVFLLMVAIGMSLNVRELRSRWSRHTALDWTRLLLSAFVVPAAVSLALTHFLRLDREAVAGLFMISVAPGAPLVTRNAAKRGFDLHLAASYQVWCALLVPIMVPILVAAGGLFYHRYIWVEPTTLLRQIAVQQFLPLACGLLLVSIVPAVSERIAKWLALAGGILLNVLILLFLIKMGPQLLQLNPLVFVAATGIAGAALGSILLLGSHDPRTNLTLALCNTNRHVGLAILMTGQYLHIKSALPSIAAYAICASVVMILYARLARERLAATQHEAS